MGQLATQTGLAPSTIRYYMATGLVPPARRLSTRRHVYDERHLESLRLVQLLKERRHLPVDAIRKILPELLQLPAGGAFRPEMWEELVAARERSTAAVSPASRLLEAGLSEFRRRGYSEVRVEDVCQTAHLAKGSFYRYYASKEELYFAAAREAGRQAGQRFLDLPGPAGAEEGAGLLEEEAVQLLSRAIEPDLPLFLDLMALAAQRRPGHGRVLREVFTHLYRIVTSRLGPASLPRNSDILERALVGGLRRVVVSPLLDRELVPGETAL